MLVTFRSKVIVITEQLNEESGTSLPWPEPKPCAPYSNGSRGSVDQDVYTNILRRRYNVLRALIVHIRRAEEECEDSLVEPNAGC